MRKALKFILPQKRISRSVGGDVFIFIFLVFMAFLLVIPLIYIVSNSLKPYNELFLFPPKILVQNPTLDNFGDLFTLISNSWVPFSRYRLNTVCITVAGTVGNVILGSMAAYAISKIRFPGAEALFRIIVLSLMFSSVVTAIPTYIIIAKIGWIDTYWALIVPSLQSSLGIYLMKQFIDQIPDTLLEAARIDGATDGRIYLSIIMPSVKPAWLTVIILSIQSLWNITGSNYIFSEQLKTLPVAMNQIVTGGIARAGAAAAVSVVMLSVPVISFVIAQSQVVETMASSGMKE
ncbi:MAG: carbohydrate ABC transporter permease [Clostridia bacterium]|nr:carbohydrate ABC transporter permease [Clostridia bacterium]